MAGRDLVVRRSLRQLGVDAPALRLVRVPSNRRGDEWVRRTDLPSIVHEQPGVDGRTQLLVGGEPRAVPGAQSARQRNGESQAADGRLELRDAESEQVVDRCGNRNLVTDLERVAVGQRARDLEREERIATGQLGHALQHPA